MSNKTHLDKSGGKLKELRGGGDRYCQGRKKAGEGHRTTRPEEENINVEGRNERSCVHSGRAENMKGRSGTRCYYNLPPILSRRGSGCGIPKLSGVEGSRGVLYDRSERARANARGRVKRKGSVVCVQRRASWKKSSFRRKLWCEQS